MENDILKQLEYDANQLLNTPTITCGYSIKPLTVAQMIMASKEIIKIKQEDLDDLPKCMDLSSGKFMLPYYWASYGEVIRNVTTIALGEDKSDTMTADEQLEILAAVLYRMGNPNFLKSISYIAKLNLYQKAELIAAQKRIDSSTSQS